MENQLNFIGRLLAKISAIASPVLLFIGIVALSFGSIFIKWSENELSPDATVFNRFWLATVFFALWQFAKVIIQFRAREPIQQQPYTYQNLLILSTSGISFALNLVCIAWSLTQTSVAISTVLHNLAPIFTSLGAWLLFNQGFNRQFVIGMVIAFAGAIGIEIEELSTATSNLVGSSVAILSAIFATAYLLAVEKLRAKFDSVTIQLWVCGISVIVMLPFVLLSGNEIFPSTLSGWTWVISLALVCQIVGQGLLTYSLNKFSSVVVSLVHLLEPIISSLFAWVIFWERLSFSNWIGFIILLIGLYIAVSSQVTAEID
ncbi:MAG: DMT family transporter [Calothrix sp. FI2-JRJ7]|jgi:drug/metabolite transporter (DMT)-like permease|nr:DMT family transporter [Calothrix sp. FI2-JRJ7]